MKKTIILTPNTVVSTLLPMMKKYTADGYEPERVAHLVEVKAWNVIGKYLTKPQIEKVKEVCFALHNKDRVRVSNIPNAKHGAMPDWKAQLKKLQAA